MTEASTFVACSACFRDRGLQLDAEQIGITEESKCPNCPSTLGKKLSADALGNLAYRFFVWGSLWRPKYGAAPLIQFNGHQKTSIEVSPWLKVDVEIFEKILGVGFFHYGPRFWMFGEVEPLKALQKAKTRPTVVDRIIKEYPERVIDTGFSFYRIRKSPKSPSDANEYDSPPAKFANTGRLDSNSLPILYASPDLQVCVHECRVAAEDELFVATLAPTRSLRLLDLSVLLKEPVGITEFESLDISVHMLFLAGKHSYKLTREIAIAANKAGFDGIVYPSYFSLLRIGVMPFQTVYGISNRRIPEYQEYEQANAVPNLALFGRPIENGSIEINTINKLILSRVVYDFHFGPVSF